MRVHYAQAVQSPLLPVGDGANVNKTSKTNPRGLKDKGTLLFSKLHKQTMSMEETNLIETSLQAYSVEFISFPLY